MGFVHALQLVLAEAVPTITEVVQVNCSSSSDSDMEEEDDKDGEMGPPTTKICPRHARGVHVAAEAAADCIIPDDGENEVEDITFSWTDDEGDELVNNILKLINEDHAFNRQMFGGGGVTRGDVIRMRKEAEAENAKNAKQKQRKQGGTAEDGSVSGSCGEGVLSGEADMTEIVYLITRKVKDEMGLLGEKEKMAKMQEALIDVMKNQLPKAVPIMGNVDNESNGEDLEGEREADGSGSGNKAKMPPLPNEETIAAKETTMGAVQW
ncbi:unnamed protein product [Arabis nemorensis]|uniref:Uncharacterized protein n=1 Tax=Arabis nemorensis TaxID=586526 RepID=A0A565CEI8_9BRAS|nr:unnamed protein product [Arabis nemorensis]